MYPLWQRVHKKVLIVAAGTNASRPRGLHSPARLQNHTGTREAAAAATDHGGSAGGTAGPA
jgi:hypothetical protein